MPVYAAKQYPAVVLEGGERSRRRTAGVALTIVGILVGFYAQRQVDFVLGDWDGYWRERVDEVRGLLSDELDRRQLAGEAAADELIGMWADTSRTFDPGGPSLATS